MDSNVTNDRSLVLTAQGIRTLRTKPLTPRESFTLWHLVSTLPLTGSVLSNVKLSEELAIDVPNVSVIMKRLCVLGFIMRGPKVGRSYHYKLNPAYFKILS